MTAAAGATDLPGCRGVVRSLVFDLDGTLYVNRSFGREILATAARYLADLRGADAAEMESLLKETRSSLTRENGNECTLSVACSALGGDIRDMHRRFSQELRPQDFLAPDPQVLGLLAELAHRYPLFIYTNNNVPLTHRILQVLESERFFEHIFTIEDTWHPKPDRATLDLVLAAAGAPPEVLFVGDRFDVDLRLPAELGAPVHLVTTIDDLLALRQLL